MCKIKNFCKLLFEFTQSFFYINLPYFTIVPNILIIFMVQKSNLNLEMLLVARKLTVKRPPIYETKKNRSISTQAITSRRHRGSSFDNKENVVKQSLNVLKPKKQIQKGLPPIKKPVASHGSDRVPDLSSRKFIDLQRWYCISRPQQPKECGITSLVACWNYLFSEIGKGTLPFITPDQALSIVKTSFSVSPGNHTLLKWFEELCEHFGVKGRAVLYWKKGITSLEPDKIYKRYIEDVKNPNKAFIYHCHNHYFTPIGFDITPGDPALGYCELEDCNMEECEPWVVLGETSRKQPVMHFLRWKEVAQDILCNDLFFYDVREKFKGMQVKRERSKNNHCFMLFEKLS